MSYLLDTNVISEALRPKPNRNVQKWFQEIPDDELYLSVLTLGEIRKGIAKLDNGKRKTQLVSWLDHKLPLRFGARLLPIDLTVADRWGCLLAAVDRPIPAIDSLLAATALTFNLKMVTRNIADFNVTGLEVINPWD